MIIQEIPEAGVEEQDKCRSIVILDSGSDVSLFPMTFAGNNTESSQVRLQDCQGMPLETAGQREATLVAQTRCQVRTLNYIIDS